MRPSLVLRPALAALLLGAVVAPRARAQINETTPLASGETATFILGAGPSFPVGDLRDAGKNGFAGLIAVGIAPPVIRVGLRLEGLYQEFGLKDSDANVSTLGANVNAVVRLPSGLPTVGAFLRPFVTGGVGYARTRFGLGGATSPDVGDGNGVTWNVGGGISLPVPIINVGLEARYVEVRANGGSLGSVPVFVTLNFRR